MSAVNSQAALFGDAASIAPATEGIKYAGSKLKILPHILRLAGRTGARSIYDGFAGSTRVSQAFAQSGYQVCANDLSAWSAVFATAYLTNTKDPKEYQGLIEHLNALKPIDGWFTAHYGGDVCAGPKGSAIQPDGSKKPWQRKNTRKLDAIRDEIDELHLDAVSRNVALASLILGLDRVDSTLGHYASYLKDWSPRSYNDLRLEVPKLWVNKEGNNKVLSGDIFDSLSAVESDLAYYDPPYGSNNEKMPPSRVRYAAYYHLWTTVVKHDKPALFGKALRREDSSDRAAASLFEEFRKDETGRFIAVDAIERLLARTPCEWILLSYSSGGRATANDLNEVISNHGLLIDMVEVDYQKNVMSAMTWTNAWVAEAEKPNKEFLFLIRKP